MWVSCCNRCPPPPAPRSPLNEDVFTVLRGCEGRGATPDMAPLSEQIQRLLGRPVHSGGSRGSSGSQASRRSHPPRAPASSSSDSNGAPAQEAVAAATALAVATALATAAAATDTHKPVRLAAVVSNRPQTALKGPSKCVQVCVRRRGP